MSKPAGRELSDDACMQQALAWVDYSGKEGASLTFDEWASTKGLAVADHRRIFERVSYILMRGKVQYAPGGEAA